MEKYIDLHAHSTASDGSMSPKDLVRRGKDMGLSAIAVTDHDTIDGIEEALEEGRNSEIEVIPGIEISVEYKPEMHILGYFSPKNYRNISGTLAELLESREQRNPKIIKKLNEMGFAIDMEEVIREAGGKVIGRPHIARVLVKKGYIKSTAEAFDKFLSFGKPAFFKKEKYSPEQGISEILKAGGVPVLAHPVHLYLSFDELDSLLSVLKKFGLKGIETYYVDNTQEDTENILELAAKHELLPTGGSDFHGSFKPDIELGKGRGNLRVPYELLEKIKAQILL